MKRRRYTAAQRAEGLRRLEAARANVKGKPPWGAIPRICREIDVSRSVLVWWDEKRRGIKA